jgi:ribosomal protein S18 acetylase RimI-like enzyme
MLDIGYWVPNSGHCTIVGESWQATLTVRRFAGIVGRMVESDGTAIRPFDGSLADAEGLLAVEKATFDESPYSAEQVRDMLVDGPQRAWLAVGDGDVVGFVIAFATTGLRGTCWEIDFLAVLSAWRGRHLATRLISAAVSQGAAKACRARAVVATDNPASERAFARAGFRRGEQCVLLIYRPQDQPLAPWSAPGVTVREAASIGEVTGWLPRDGVARGPGMRQGPQEFTLLLVEEDGRPAGYAELSEVQTILYRGVWIESMGASTQIARAALVHTVLSQAASAGLDEVGAMVPGGDRPWQEALFDAGFRSLGEFHWFIADLPLPGMTTPPSLHGAGVLAQDHSPHAGAGSLDVTGFAT